MKLVSFSKKPAQFDTVRGLTFINSDLAFATHYVYQANFAGFTIWDVTDPAKPVMASVVECITSQGAPSITRTPEKPVRLAAQADTNFQGWHTAVFSNDGKKVVFTDEWGGGTGPMCQANSRRTASRTTAIAAALDAAEQEWPRRSPLGVATPRPRSPVRNPRGVCRRGRP